MVCTRSVPCFCLLSSYFSLDNSSKTNYSAVYYSLRVFGVEYCDVDMESRKPHSLSLSITLTYSLCDSLLWCCGLEHCSSGRAYRPSSHVRSRFRSLSTLRYKLIPVLVSAKAHFLNTQSSGAQTSIFVAVGSAGGQLVLPMLVGALFDTPLGTISLMWTVLVDTLVSFAMLALLFWATRRLAASAQEDAT